jgi:hypothetical protein
MALSHDGKFFACILQNPHVENVPGQLYILPLEELLNSGSNRQVSSYIVCSSNVSRSEVLSQRSSVISTLSTSTSTTRLPWTRGYSSLTLPHAAEDVCEFCFSELDVLYAVSQPEQSADLEEHKVTVLSWSIGETERRAHRPIGIIDDVSGQVWRRTLIDSS